MLRQRLISALVGVPVVLAAIWFGDPWLSILVGAFALLGTYEFFRLTDSAGWRPLYLPGLILVLLFVINAHSDDERTTPLLVSATVLIPLASVLWLSTRQRAFASWVSTVAAVLYLGWTLSHFVFLRDLDDGRDWVFIALLATFASDTSAFFIGRAWGRHRMAREISPGKTWEGAVGGVVGAMAATTVLAIVTGVDEIGWARLLPLGLLVSVFAQIGDLAESQLKRNVGAKDAGRTIPGHGGVLDRLDSVTFTVVLVYYWVVFVVE